MRCATVLKAGDNLILFPEGTSSDGSRVLPFRTSFFAVAEVRAGEDRSELPLIQPVSVVYDRLGGLPTGRASRPVFAWYGDMDIASHFWRSGAAYWAAGDGAAAYAAGPGSVRGPQGAVERGVADRRRWRLYLATEPSGGAAGLAEARRVRHARRGAGLRLRAVSSKS